MITRVITVQFEITYDENNERHSFAKLDDTKNGIVRGLEPFKNLRFLFVQDSPVQYKPDIVVK